MSNSCTVGMSLTLFIEIRPPCYVCIVCFHSPVKIHVCTMKRASFYLLQYYLVALPWLALSLSGPTFLGRLKCVSFTAQSKKVDACDLAPGLDRPVTSCWWHHVTSSLPMREKFRRTSTILCRAVVAVLVSTSLLPWEVSVCLHSSLPSALTYTSRTKHPCSLFSTLQALLIVCQSPFVFKT